MGNPSIRKRLPVIICSLVFVVVVAFSAISYLGLRKASLKAGEQRLRSITEQLSNMFGQSSQTFLQSSRTAASNDSIRQFLLSGGAELKEETNVFVNNLIRDSLSVKYELVDRNMNPLLESSKKGVTIKEDMGKLVSQLVISPDSARIGKIIQAGDSMFYPVVAAVTRDKQIIGYAARWRLLHTTPKAIDQFSKLLGTDAKLYIGNKNGDLWTDLIKPVPKPQSAGLMQMALPIPNSPWQVMVGFPKKAILVPASNFLEASIVFGSILILIAFAAAWFLSRNITRPLKKLTEAAAAIAEGDYSTTVVAERNDELGKLASAFNSMIVQVHNAQLDLEKKVQERTTQLQASNKELEAFSYSVSHDLRAPLRAISGYSVILKEDYGTKLDDGAHRITDKIITNAKMMGQLIDSLIAFSQMGASAIVAQRVDMRKMAESCVKEILSQEKENKYQVRIDDMPACEGDPNLLRQVWMNLISNAVKYSSKSAAPSIEIGCTEGPEMNIYYIRDNGVGFDMNHSHKLFGVFQRLHHQRDFEGTGIGLAFTKRIITKHNGDIWAESKLNEGASFYFSLPTLKNLRPEILEKNEYRR